MSLDILKSHGAAVEMVNEQAARINALETALMALVYQDDDTKRWRTTKHGDYDVTDIVSAVLPPWDH